MSPTPFEQALERTYPCSLPFATLRERLRTSLGARGYTAANTLFANATCRDELNRGPLSGIAADWGESFELSGLGGFPSAGLTGFRAYAGHVPDEGHLLVLYGPHVGISASGAIGEVTRHGQDRPSSACGALVAFLEKIEKNLAYAPKPDPLDPEQSMLEDVLVSHARPILAHPSPIYAVTEHAFDVIDSQLLLIVRESGYTGPIALVGGIMINGPIDTDDRFAPRRAAILPEQTSFLEELLDESGLTVPATKP